MEADAQPCRFIARRATNGAPPSEATQPGRKVTPGGAPPHHELRAGGVPPMGVGQGGSMSFALLGYPRSRKNGGHSAFRD